MPYGAGAAYNTIRAASTASLLHRSGRVVEQIRRRRNLLNIILGDTVPDLKNSGVKFERVRYLSGREIKMPVIGKRISGSILNKGSAELGSSVVTASDHLLAASFDYALYFNKQYIAQTEIDAARGKPKEIDSLIQTYVTAMTDGFMETLATAIAGNALPGGNAIGGLQAMVSNGINNSGATDESAFANYGIDRSDAGNVFWRSNYMNAANDFTLDKLAGYIASSETTGSTITLLALNPAPYVRLRRSTELMNGTTFDERINKIGARHVVYNGVAILADDYLPASQAYLLDPDSFVIYMQEQDQYFGDLTKDDSKQRAWYLELGAYVQFLCDRPSSNTKIVNVN